MSDSCKTSLRYIDGKAAPAFCMSELCFEGRMHDDYDYVVAPKSNITSITKQDLTDHPEKFRPFVFSRSTDFEFTNNEFIDYLKYTNGKWTYFDNVCWIDEPGNSAPYPEFIDFDVMYMEKYYPDLYKEILKNNGLPETYSLIKETGNKYNLPDLTPKSSEQNENQNREAASGSNGSTKSIITPNGVNGGEKGVEINYTYIPESPDLKL